MNYTNTFLSDKTDRNYFGRTLPLIKNGIRGLYIALAMALLSACASAPKMELLAQKAESCGGITTNIDEKVFSYCLSSLTMRFDALMEKLTEAQNDQSLKNLFSLKKHKNTRKLIQRITPWKDHFAKQQTLISGFTQASHRCSGKQAKECMIKNELIRALQLGNDVELYSRRLLSKIMANKNVDICQKPSQIPPKLVFEAIEFKKNNKNASIIEALNTLHDQLLHNENTALGCQISLITPPAQITPLPDTNVLHFIVDHQYPHKLAIIWCHDHDLSIDLSYPHDAIVIKPQACVGGIRPIDIIVNKKTTRSLMLWVDQQPYQLVVHGTEEEKADE